MYRIIITLIMFTAVASAEDDPITKYVVLLPWHGCYATFPENNDKPDFIITISYEKKEVVSDKNILPFKLYPESRTSGRYVRHFKCRDSFGTQGKWCNGAANVSGVNQDGFAVDLSLTWGGVNISTESFKESFNCVWTSKQEFTTNGFHVVVETVKCNAEQTNSPYSSSAADSKR